MSWAVNKRPGSVEIDIVSWFWPRFTLWFPHQAPRAHVTSSQLKTGNVEIDIVSWFWPRFTLWFRHQAPRAHVMSCQQETRERRNWHCKLVLTPVHLVVSTPSPQSTCHELSTKNRERRNWHCKLVLTPVHLCSPWGFDTRAPEHMSWRALNFLNLN